MRMQKRHGEKEQNTYNWSPKKRDERENETEGMSEEILAKNFPKWMKNIKPQIQIPNRIKRMKISPLKIKKTIRLTADLSNTNNESQKG